MFKKRQKRNFYNVPQTYKNLNSNKIIEQTRSILNNEKQQQPIKQPIIKQEYQRPKTQTEWTNFHKMNEDGIKQAYQKPEGYHIDGNKLYIAGTRGLTDVMDWYKIPLGTFSSSHIYIKILNMFLKIILI